MRKLLFILTIACASVLCIPASASTFQGQDATEKEEIVPEISVARNSFTVKVAEECNLVFEVYSITGHLIKKFRLESKSYTLELPRGYYIVKCASWSKKVIIKG